jgi:hypothetical protein
MIEEPLMYREDIMTTSNQSKFPTGLRFFVLGLIFAVAGCAAPANMQPTSHAINPQQDVFATPDAGVTALIAATRADQKAELLKILGPQAEKLVHSGDKVADKNTRARITAAYDKAHKLETEDDGRQVLVVGEEEWPMPIPLVYVGSGWQFDTAAGMDEILNRRIGRNELNVIEVCRTYVDAQREFAAQHKLGDHGHEYAQRFVSTEGKQDGLYWPTAEGQPESPFGPLIATATAEGYSDKALGKLTPYHGYYYKILKAQGPHAPTGAKDYMVDGHMTRGFALVAFPARYGDSGVMTFIVNRHGIVFEKNLGPATAKIAARITTFDPDDSWHVVR